MATVSVMVTVSVLSPLSTTCVVTQLDVHQFTKSDDDWPAYAPQVDAWTRAFARSRPAGRVVELATGIPTRFDPGEVGNWVFVSERARDAA